MVRLLKKGLKFSRIAGKQIIEKSAQVAGDKVGDLIANKITSIGNKPENNEPQQEQEEIIIPPERRQQIIDYLRLL